MALKLNRAPTDPTKPPPPPWQRWYSDVVALLNELLTGIQSGTGSPEGVVAAPQGTLFRRTDGGAATSLYVKSSGGVVTPTNTGWSALS